MAKTVDLRRFNYVYTGPTIRGGLSQGDPCAKVKAVEGGYKIRDEDGRLWIVGVTQIARVA